MAAMDKKRKKKTQNILVISGVLGFVVIGMGLIFTMMLSDSGGKRKTRISTVTLLRPPPPEEKPPEPKIQPETPKQQDVVEQVATPQPGPQNDQPKDAGQSGPLGVEGDGSAGGDSFGLAARGKGGRSLIGGGSGGGLSKMGLLTKYGWYTKKVEKEVWQRVKAILDKDGGFPQGKHLVTVHLVLNGNGAVAKYQVVASSGNEKVDKAVKNALAALRVSEPLPDGMPSGMTIRISSSQG